MIAIFDWIVAGFAAAYLIRNPENPSLSVHDVGLVRFITTFCANVISLG